MWFIRGLFLLGAFGCATWGFSNIESVGEWINIHNRKQEVITLRVDPDTAEGGAVAPSPVLQAPFADDPMAGGEVRTALGNLLLADPIEYSVAADSAGGGIGSEVVRNGWWEPSTGHGGLTTEIEMTDTYQRTDPFGKVAASLGADTTTMERTRSVTLTVSVDDDGVTLDTDGSGPQTVPDDLAAQLSASIDPILLLVNPLLRELGSVERMDGDTAPAEGSRAYRASFTGDVMAGLGVEPSLMAKLEAAGFDGRTGVDIPATILISDDGSLTIDIDLSPWWASVLTEAPAVPPTTQTVQLILKPGGGPRA